MITKEIVFFGKNVILACDARCDKAWGINKRPSIALPEDGHGFASLAYLGDHELGIAPADPCTYEGGCTKPVNESDRLNKWCARECERSTIVDSAKEIHLPDFPGVECSGAGDADNPYVEIINSVFDSLIGPSDDMPR